MARPLPSGPTRSAWYSHGYQSALDDLALCLAEGGAARVREWILANTDSTQSRDLVKEA